MVQNGRPLGNMVIKLGLDSSAFSDSLTGATRATKTAVKEMQAGFKIADAGGNKLTTLATKQEGLTKVIKAQKNELKYLGEAYQKTYDEQGNATSKTAKAAQKYNEAQAKLASYEAQLKTTTAQMARMRIETEGLTGWLNQKGDQWIASGKKITKFGDGVQKVGSTMTKALTVPLATGFTLATKKAADFQTQIGEIGPLLTNGGAITEKYRQQLDQMSDSSKKWAKQYGVSTNEINNGLAEVVRKGYDANQTMGVMPSILDATKASGEEFNDVMNVTTEVISQFGLKGKTYNETLTNAARVTDSLTYVANATSAGFSDLGLAMGYIGPVANSLGMEVEETAAAVGLLSDAGLGGEKAGTALRGALTRLLKPSKQNIEGFKKLGVSVKDFKNGTLTLPDILDKIKTNTDGWTDAQRTAAIALAFGTESQSAMNVLVNQGGDALRGLTKDTKGASGATKDIAKSMNDLPANKVARFKESLNVLAITVGEKLLPVVTPWIEKATDMVNKFSELDDATQKNIVKWGLMAAAAGPALKVVGSGISILGKAKTGVGLLSKKLVELTAKAAEKKALADLAMDVTKVGTAASTAAGSQGVGAMITALVGSGGLASALAVGLGGLAVGGTFYGLWKTFGEEWWNSSQRVKQWGSDVGETTAQALEELRGHAQNAGGEFSLLEQGISGNTENIVNNFSKMGKSIETEMTNKIAALKEMVNTLPADIKSAADELTQDEISNQQKYLDIVKENNEKMTKIREAASKAHRDLTYEDTVRIKSLAQESAEAYVNSLGKSEKESKAILSAMTGNVSDASKEQATEWLQSLGKQRQNSKVEYTKMQDDLKKTLVDNGYDLNSKYAKEMLGLLETSSKSATQITEDQMATILAKYPELADEVFLANGQLISSMGDAAASAVGQNKKMMETFGDFSATISQTAKDNQEKTKLMLDEANEFGEFWNGLVLDPKTGEVKTNAQDAVNEAAKSEQGWNQLMWLSKDADVSSNVKLMIAEAAIANGKWETLSFSEQQAMLDSNITQTMTQAVQANGDWKKLSFEEKKALIYSNTPETMAETMVNLGLWDKYQPEIKELNAKNAGFLGIIAKSEEKLGNWNSISAETKEILGDNYDLLQKLYESDERFNLWKQIPDSQKFILGNNEDLILKITGSEATFNAWNQLPETEKKILGNNQDVLEKILASEKTYNLWTSLPEVEKHMLGNNSDLLSKVFASEKSVKAWNALPANVKGMLGDNADILSKVRDGTISIETYNRKVYPNLKALYGDDSSLQAAINGATGEIDFYNRNIHPSTKTVSAVDNASGPANNAFDSVLNFKNNLPNTITKTIKADFIGPTLNAKGTNYHPGGPMIVNDQKGPLYREMVVRPTGEAFIPFGKNVLLPNEPVGTKVYTANKTRQMVPRYANGVGVPENSTIVKNLRNVATATKDTINFKVDHLNSKALDQIAKNSAMTSNLLAVLVDFFKANNRSDSQLAMDLLKTISRGGLG